MQWNAFVWHELKTVNRTGRRGEWWEKKPYKTNDMENRIRCAFIYLLCLIRSTEIQFKMIPNATVNIWVQKLKINILNETQSAYKNRSNDNYGWERQWKYGVAIKFFDSLVMLLSIVILYRPRSRLIHTLTQVSNTKKWHPTVGLGMLHK